MAFIPLPTIATFVPSEGLSIGAVADLTGLSVDTLRYYEREGLLLDPAPRDAGGRRRYGQNDLDWIAGLIMLRETGMSIADVRRMAVLSRDPGTERDRLVVLEEHRLSVLAELDHTPPPRRPRDEDRRLPQRHRSPTHHIRKLKDTAL